MEYFERNLLVELKKWIGRREIFAIRGPRQSGKSTLLLLIKQWLLNEKKISEKNIIFVTFEDREVLDSFDENSTEFIESYISEKEKHYFFIDEAQYCKNIGQKLKLLYDTHKNVKFIITGSSSLELTQQTAKFLVGRVFLFELLPLNFYEFLKVKNERLANIFFNKNKEIKDFIFKKKSLKIPKKDIFVKELEKYFDEYVLFGGYPEVVKAKTKEEKRIILKNIFNTYVEKDILAFLRIKHEAKFRKVVQNLAFTNGGLISYEKICTQHNINFKELTEFIDVLKQTYIIRFLRPFHKNLVTELKKTPKVYFVDMGLRNQAINNFNKLDMREDSGRLAENFVLNELSHEETQINFWRTTAKAEVDFILNQIPIEIKFSQFKKPKTTPSFTSFLKNYNPKKAIIATKNTWLQTKKHNSSIKFIPVIYF